MKKIILLISISLIIVGCASAKRSAELAKRTGVEHDAPDGFRIERVVLNKPSTNVDADKVGYCLTSNMNVEAIQLTDSSKSFVGSYTGKYYDIKSNNSIDNERVITFISKDGVNSVSKGQINYIISNWAVSIKKYVRFTLDLQQSAAGNTYTFKNLYEAQADTGAVANTGFVKWADADELTPEKGYDELDKLADQINNCLVK